MVEERLIIERGSSLIYEVVIVKRKEVQPKKRFDIYQKLKGYKQELEELQGGQT